MNGMNGMGDMFVYPQDGGVGPNAFFEQQIATGAMPTPAQEFVMEESALYSRGNEGAMAWESAPAPWDMASTGSSALTPAAAPAAIDAMNASNAKAVQAAKAAKVAADNAVRAARSGAPRVAATNAATAQAAANVAAQVAQSEPAQKAAALAQNEATKAVAAANIAAQNGMAGLGVGAVDNFYAQYKWWLIGGAIFAGIAYATKGTYWGK